MTDFTTFGSHPDIDPDTGHIDVDGEIVTSALDVFHGQRSMWSQPSQPLWVENSNRLNMVRALEKAFRMAHGILETHSEMMNDKATDLGIPFVEYPLI